MSNIPDREGRWGRILGEDTKRAGGQEMGKSDKAEKTAGGIPQGQMSASLPTWPGSPPSPSPSSGLPVACSTPAVSLQVAVLRSWPNATAMRSGLSCCAHSRRFCYCFVKKVFPPHTPGPSRTAPSADRLTSPTFAQPKLSTLLAARLAPSTSLGTV